MTGLAGAVLTGGSSRRMGSDKALLEVEGVALARRTADVLAASGADPIVAIGGDGDALGRLGLVVVADRWPGEGPLGGIVTALDHFSATAERVLVVACDLPALDAPLLSALIHTATEADLVLASSGRLEPLVGVWTIAPCLVALQRCIERGERAVHRALTELRVEAVAVTPALLVNANHPEDLAGR